MKVISRENIDSYVINLDSRQDRLTAFDQDMKRVGWTYQRYSAKTNKTHLPIQLHNQAEEGCFASHFYLIKEAYERNNGKIVCVFEDDALLCADFIERFEYLEKEFCFTDWDMLYLSAYYHMPDNVPSDWYNYDVKSPFWSEGRMQTYHLTSVKYVHWSHASFTSVAYLINPKSLKKIYLLLLTEMNKLDPRYPTKGLTRAIDHIQMNLQEENKIVALTATPGLVTQRACWSDLKGEFFDQTDFFTRVCGLHIYTNRLSDFPYDQYFHVPPLDKWNIEDNYFDNDIWNLYGTECMTYRRYYPVKPGQKRSYCLYFTPYFRQYFPQATQLAEYEFQLDADRICESSQVVEYLKGFKQDAIFIDVGGNCGLMCIPAGLAGYTTFSFEPVIDNLICLRQSVEANHLKDKVFIEPYALAEKNQSCSIYVPEFKDNASLHQGAAVANLKEKTSQHQWCQCLTFDYWLENNRERCNPAKIKFIKIDVQGFELSVLKGMKGFLTEAEDLHIFYEIDDNMSNIANQNAQEIHGLLTSLGFTRITSADQLLPYDRYVSRIDYSLGGNALYVKNPKPKRMNLMDTTFIIPLRIDSQDRLDNANIVLNYLGKYFETKIIVLESDQISHFDQIHLDYPEEITHIFEETHDPVFHRTRLLNRMLSMVKTPVTVTYDIDGLLAPENYIIARNMIIEEGYDMVYPFSNPTIEQFKKTNQRLKEAYQQWKQECLISQPCSDKGGIYSYRENYHELFNQIVSKNHVDRGVLGTICSHHDRQTHVCLDSEPDLENMFTRYGATVFPEKANKVYSKGIIYVPSNQKEHIRQTLNLDCLNGLELLHSISGTGIAVFLKTQSYIAIGGENEEFISWGPEDQERTYKMVQLGYKVSSLYGHDLFKQVDGDKTGENTCLYPGYDPCFKAVYHLEHQRDRNSSGDNPHYETNNQLYQTIKSYDLGLLKQYYTGKYQELVRKYPSFKMTGLPAGLITMLDLGLNGRLGNQMFQYAFVLALSVKSQRPVYLPRLKSNDGLQCLKLDDYFELQDKSQWLWSLVSNCPGIIKKYRHQEIPQVKQLLDTCLIESSFAYNPSLMKGIEEGCGRLEVQGFFQSWKYFAQEEAKVREAFTFKKAIRETAIAWLNALKAKYPVGTPIVACHVRRGDNLPLGRPDLPHYVLNQRYVEKCFDVIEAEVGQRGVFVIFSDGLEWCRHNLDAGRYQLELCHNVGGDGVEMCLMSMCDHHIISPSSFSWWGAYLNPNPHKVVLVPHPWFRRDHPTLSQYETTDLIPPTWRKVEITDQDHL